MMDRTDRHDRYFLRQLSRRVLLYSEMVVTKALLHGDREYLAGFDPEEHPIALQLGGDDPAELAVCAKIAEDMGYDEVNLNVGCPSSRVQSGCFGVVLMRRPGRVAEAVVAMRDAVGIPVTVKHRIGVDELDRYEDMLNFVDVVAESGADRFTVHARKAWLKGLSPKENRNVPPLRYDDVYRLKGERSSLPIELNGGVRTLDEALTHLEHVDAVMIGRAATDTPIIFAEADQRVFGDDGPVVTRDEVVERMAAYLDRWIGRPRFRPHHVTRHMLTLYAGVPGARAWKRALTEGAATGAGSEVLDAGLQAVREAQARKAAFDASRGALPPA